MTASVFVDTNVLLYAVDFVNREKHTLARRWRRIRWESGRGKPSFRVLQEFYANFARKWSNTVGRAEVADLLAWHPVPVDGEILRAGGKLQDRYGLSFSDSLIAAAAQAASCEFLLSEDFHPGQAIDGVRVINPFGTQPEEI